MAGPIGTSLPDREDGVTLQQVAEALATAWCRETCTNKREWTPQNPSWDQSLSTAVLIRRLFKGNIQRTTVGIPDNIKWPSERARTFRHYYNELETGEGVDLTAVQFPLNSQFHISKQRDEPRIRAVPFGSPTIRRAILLEKRVYKVLGVEWGRPVGYMSPGDKDLKMTDVEVAPGLVVASSRHVGKR